MDEALLDAATESRRAAQGDRPEKRTKKVVLSDCPKLSDALRTICMPILN